MKAHFFIISSHFAVLFLFLKVFSLVYLLISWSKRDTNFNSRIYRMTLVNIMNWMRIILIGLTNFFILILIVETLLKLVLVLWISIVNTLSHCIEVLKIIRLTFFLILLLLDLLSIFWGYFKLNGIIIALSIIISWRIKTFALLIFPL